MNITRFSAILLAVACSGAWVPAADLYHYEVSELKALDCVADINLHCGTHSEARYCNPAPLIWTAYSVSVQDYELTDIGVIHEISRGAPGGNLSMAVHVYGLGALNFR